MANLDVDAVLKKLTLTEKVKLLSSMPVRGIRFFNGVPAACFPCGTALGSTFNQELLKQAGKTICDERSPLSGRGFKSISEDLFLSGLGAAALVRGIQSTSVIATVKHFLYNDQEDKHIGVQSIVTEQALREIYAIPF
ncbi:hypothetical protein MY10362_007860 [Beauveria mimosiformis]